MSLLTIPNTFANGTGPSSIIDATQMNANFTAVATAVNNIYPSQILPLTSGQATFGATATGVGYKFLANDATATPLTIQMLASQSVAGLAVNGAASITGNIFEADLTAGGTKALFVTPSGGLALGAGGLTLGVGQLGVSSTTSTGAITLGGTVSSGGWDYGVTTGATYTWAVAGTPRMTLSATNLATTGVISGATLSINGGATTVTGQISAAASASSGVFIAGSVAATAGALDYGATTAGKWSFQFDLSSPSYAPVNGGAYTNASDAAFKSNIAPLASGTAEIMALKPSSFTVNNTGAPGLGFIAQDVQAVLPDLVSADGNGMLGVCYDGIIPVLVKAFQELNAAYTAYIAAHP